MTSFDIALNIYRALIKEKNDTGIHVTMNSPSLVGTVQNDPFDNSPRGNMRGFKLFRTTGFLKEKINMNSSFK